VKKSFFSSGDFDPTDPYPNLKEEDHAKIMAVYANV
jgi:hypothetical protein